MPLELGVSYLACQEIIVTAEPNSRYSAMAVLSKATLNAADYLGLSHSELGQLLGISESSISQLVAFERFIDPHGHEGELALMLVRIFRALDALVGGDADARITWMNAHNQAIGDMPKHSIQTRSGLEHTLTYLNNQVSVT